MFYFSRNSLIKLNTCNKKIISLFQDVIKYHDCTILEGYRTKERQEKLYKEGKSKVITSKHNSYPSNAIDVSPYPIPDKSLESREFIARYYYFAGIVFGIAKMKEINLRWGGDWNINNKFNDQTFNDLQHFELIL